jgi:hypothetical protein
LLLVCLAAGLVAGCGDDDGLITTTSEASTPSAAVPDYAAEWQQTVDAFAALQPRRDIPEHLLQEGAAFDGTEFDVETFFTVLDRIDTEPVFVLDYVYRVTPDRGFPILYIHREDEPGYSGYDEYLAAVGPGSDSQGDRSYFDQIYVVDGTPEGFFQYVVLHIMGGQFYLHWHAQMDDSEIVVTRERLDEKTAPVLAMMTPADQDRARAHDPTPRISMDDDTATAEVTVFTCWGGVLRHTYTIERVFPQQILDLQTETIAQLENCGFQY